MSAATTGRRRLGAPAPRRPRSAAGGALELTITGYAGMLAHGGDLDQQREDPELSDGLDFSNDTEVHVLARGRDEATGLEYGATIELEADTDEIVNTDETWIFLRGGWGEARLGDVDGPVDASAIGASRSPPDRRHRRRRRGCARGRRRCCRSPARRATKVRYYTPPSPGLQLGFSYTPNATTPAARWPRTDVATERGREAAAVYEAEFESSTRGYVGRRLPTSRMTRCCATIACGRPMPAPT